MVAVTLDNLFFLFIGLLIGLGVYGVSEDIKKDHSTKWAISNIDYWQ